MSGLILSQPTVERAVFAGAHDQLPETLGASLGAAFDDPLNRPTELLRDRGERVEAQVWGESEMLTPDALNAEYGDLGLSFDRPTRRDAADILARQKREEIARNDIIARGPQGLGPGLARFGAALAGSIVDPLNIASAFVPVVGQARWAGILARAGGNINRARLTKGALEGTAGAAMVAPLTYALARDQQLDYGMADVLTDIAFGGVLGGGLHWGAGKVGDWLATRKPEVRDSALRAAIAQTVEGRRVDVDPLLRNADAGPIGLDPMDPRLWDETTPAEVRLLGDAPENRSFDLGQATGAGTAERFAGYRIAPADRPWIEGVAVELSQSQGGHRVFMEVDGQGSTPEIMGVQGDTPAWFREVNAQVEAARQERAKMGVLTIDQKKALPPIPAALTRKSVAEAVGKALAGKPLGRAEAGIVQIVAEEARRARLDSARAYLDLREQRRARTDAEAEAEIDALARREAAADSDGLADPEAAQAARADAEGQDWSDSRETSVNTAQGESPATAEAQMAQEARDRLAAYENAGLLDDAALREIEDLDGIDLDPATLARDAGACLLRAEVPF